MNFEIINNIFFSIDIDYYKRTFSVVKKRNGLLIIRNVITGKIFLDNIAPEIILIDNEPMQNIEQLQMVIMNQNCLCEDDGGDGGNDDFKFFDRTFDRTFE